MPKNTPRSFTDRLKPFLSSELCFRLLIVFFALEALWIALSGLYPMAFDEEFHLGIIRLYAHHISPFWSGYPPGSDALGPVARDPSYLYQWLMSFPYRLISAITDNQAAQVIFLRLINIGLFATALPLYRRLLLKTGASRGIVHLCIALFILIPIAPLLAAQINYDNLFLPLTAISLLLTVGFSEKLRRKRFDVRGLLWLGIVMTLACLVKYAFLPVALVISVYLVIRLYQTYSGNGGTGKLRSDVKNGWKRMSRHTRWLLVGLLIVSFGLFTQRYAVNLARYHKPVPGCEEVLSVRQCSAYGPWNRDHIYARIKPADATTSPLVFTADWFYGMWFRTFFAVDGPASVYQTRGPFILPGIGAIVFSVAALGMTVASVRQMFRKYDRRVLWLFAGITGTYAIALWADGYQSFLQTGRPVALNGRYLLPVFPLLIVTLALGVNTYLKSREQLKLAIAGLALLCMLWGGGALTYILRSNDAWYWPDQTVREANHAAQDTLGPLVPGNNDPRAFMGSHGT